MSAISPLRVDAATNPGIVSFADDQQMTLAVPGVTAVKAYAMNGAMTCAFLVVGGRRNNTYLLVQKRGASESFSVVVPSESASVAISNKGDVVAVMAGAEGARQVTVWTLKQPNTLLYTNAATYDVPSDAHLLAEGVFGVRAASGATEFIAAAQSDNVVRWSSASEGVRTLPFSAGSVPRAIAFAEEGESFWLATSEAILYSEFAPRAHPAKVSVSGRDTAGALSVLVDRRPTILCGASTVAMTRPRTIEVTHVASELRVAETPAPAPAPAPASALVAEAAAEVKEEAKEEAKEAAEEKKVEEAAAAPRASVGVLDRMRLAFTGKAATAAASAPESAVEEKKVETAAASVDVAVASAPAEAAAEAAVVESVAAAATATEGAAAAAATATEGAAAAAATAEAAPAKTRFAFMALDTSSLVERMRSAMTSVTAPRAAATAAPSEAVASAESETKAEEAVEAVAPEEAKTVEAAVEIKAAEETVETKAAEEVAVDAAVAAVAAAAAAPAAVPKTSTRGRVVAAPSTGRRRSGSPTTGATRGRLVPTTRPKPI